MFNPDVSFIQFIIIITKIFFYKNNYKQRSLLTFDQFTFHYLVNAVVFLDSKKAFDTVDHHILLTKLKYYGLRGSCHEWFTSYLNNRTQTCQINCSMSNPKLVTCGVPQGTILGPLLSLLYINDLSNCLHFSQPRMYADNTSLTYASAD